MAEKEAEAKDEKAEDAPPAKKGGRLVLFAAVGGALLVGAAAGAGVLMLRGGGEPPAAHAESAEPAAEPGVEEALDGAADPHAAAEGHGDAQASAGDGHGGGAHAAGATYKLDPFIVNINDRERDRYLKLRAELELGKDAAADALEKRNPEVRDLVISLLSSKSFEEIRTIEGKNFLREEIIVRLNALVGAGSVRKVFFTEFVVQ
jgi:flagellar FliL protein